MSRTMNKEDYRKEVYFLRKENQRMAEEIKKLNMEIKSYINNQSFLKASAEKAGTETSNWKQKYILLEEKSNKIERELENIKKVNM